MLEIHLAQGNEVVVNVGCIFCTLTKFTHKIESKQWLYNNFNSFDMPRLIGKFFRAKKLRSKGYSLKEISEELNISKSTASLWFRDFKLSPLALNRLEKRRYLGRVRASETKRKKRERFEKLLREKALKLITSTDITKNHLRLFCALLFWCEGTKDTRGGIYFSNSDPSLVGTFLKLLRSSFNIQEEKLRVSLHLHEYHSPQKQILFWSKITGIPTSQFIKPYQKPHTGKRVKKDYPGCVSIRYFDSLLARELSALAQEMLDKYGGVR